MGSLTPLWTPNDWQQRGWENEGQARGIVCTYCGRCATFESRYSDNVVGMQRLPANLYGFEFSPVGSCRFCNKNYVWNNNILFPGEVQENDAKINRIREEKRAREGANGSAANGDSTNGQPNP